MKNRYAILFHPRSGSSWLSDICDNRPTSVNHYEILSLDTAKAAGFASTDLQPAAFDAFAQERVVGALCEQADGHPDKTIGFKWAPYQCKSAAMLIAQLLRENFKIIALYRRDIIASVISHIAAQDLFNRTNKANLIRENDRSEIALNHERTKKIYVDINAFEYYFFELILERSNVLMYSRAFPSASRLVVRYEDLLKAPETTARVVSEFLKTPLKPPASSSVVKNLNVGLENVVENFGDVELFLRRPGIMEIIHEFDATLPLDTSNNLVSGRW